ncbi:MAG: DNA topoisomerase [Sulfurovaceae bacterium]|nr:DNA topoisomerase [Sulfurovaceae bacterium]
MKTLILTEKREAGYQAASTLGDSILGGDEKKLGDVSKTKGYLEGDKYLLCWASGHLFTQIKPSQINANYQLFKKFENKEDYKMPNLVNEIKTEQAAEQNKQRQIKILKELLSRNDINEIIVMTDADEEGEAIGRDMLYKIVKKLPTNKITRAFNSGSFKAKEAVEKALNEREPIDTPKYNRLYDTQQVRSKGDYITGMKLIKALCDTYGRKLYTGRVKGVITALIGNREEEIKNFIPKDFYSITGKKGVIELKHFFYEEQEDENGKMSKTKQERYYEKSILEEVEKRLYKVGLIGFIEEYSKEITTTKNRPLPLSGTDFASEMMGKYKITYKQCNEILDYLRTNGFTTYPGTNGRYFSKNDNADVQNAFLTAKKYFNAEAAEYSKDVPIFDDKKAAKQNHTPLSPTAKLPTQRDVNEWQNQKLPKIKEGYELIAKRILVHFMPDDEIEKQSLTINIDDLLFFVSGQKAIKQGWRELLGQEIKNTLFETELKKGDQIDLDKIERKTGQTKCPVLFNEKTLTDIMLNISKVVDDMIKEETDPQKLQQLKKDRKLLKDAEGIGTDRTREQIISDLINEEIVLNTKDGLILSQNGNILYRVLPKHLKDPIMTAQWENAFEEIRRGEKAGNDVLAEIDNTIMNEMIPGIVNEPNKEYVMSNENKKVESDIKCPLCGGVLVETAKTYKCEHNEYKNGQQSGCKFSIFKDQTKFFGRAINGKDLPALFQATKEDPYKDGKAGIYIDPTNQYFVVAVFEQRESTPGELIETPKTFKLNDKFVFKNVYYKDLTKTEAKKLLEGNEVTLKRKTKDGKAYELKVKLDEDKPGSVVKI